MNSSLLRGSVGDPHGDELLHRRVGDPLMISMPSSAGALVTPTVMTSSTGVLVTPTVMISMPSFVGTSMTPAVMFSMPPFLSTLRLRKCPCLVVLLLPHLPYCSSRHDVASGSSCSSLAILVEYIESSVVTNRLWVPPIFGISLSPGYFPQSSSFPV